MNIWGFVSFLLFSGFWAGCHRDPWEYTRRMTAEALKVQAQDSSGGKSTNINSWGWSVEECSPESWAGLALGHNKEAIKKATKNLYWIDTNHLLYGENAKEEEKKKKNQPLLQDWEDRRCPCTVPSPRPGSNSFMPSQHSPTAGPHSPSAEECCPTETQQLPFRRYLFVYGLNKREL